MSSSTVSVSATTPTRHSFERRVDDVKPSKAHINSVIMDYLIHEGYPSAARKFAIEANIQPPIEEDSIKPRVEVRNAIHAGNIEIAINKINDLNPEILDLDPSLHFALLRLQLIELIRKCTATKDGDITPALTFATAQLAPRASTDPDFLEDLERTMALLIFPTDNLSPALANLLEPGLRRSVANRVNEAILGSQGARREAKIRSLIRLRAWAEQKAREGKKDIPSTLSLGLTPDSDNQNGEADEDDVMNGNGASDAMIS